MAAMATGRMISALISKAQAQAAAPEARPAEAAPASPADVELARLRADPEWVLPGG